MKYDRFLHYLIQNKIKVDFMLIRLTLHFFNNNVERYTRYNLIEINYCGSISHYTIVRECIGTHFSIESEPLASFHQLSPYKFALLEICPKIREK